MYGLDFDSAFIFILTSVHEGTNMVMLSPFTYGAIIPCCQYEGWRCPIVPSVSHDCSYGRTKRERFLLEGLQLVPFGLVSGEHTHNIGVQ